MSNQPTKTNEGSCPALCRLMCHAWRSSSHWRCRVLLQRVLAAPTVMLMSSAATSPDAAGGDLHRCVRRLHRHRQKFQLSVVGNFEQGTRVRVVHVWGLRSICSGEWMQCTACGGSHTGYMQRLVASRNRSLRLCIWQHEQRCHV